jgi:hypothetical protein
VLAANAVAHLLLDALQTKWGNGVHLVAPLDWQPWNLGLFWPEDPATHVLTALGLVACGWALVRVRRESAQLALPRGAAALGAAALLAGYVFMPLALSPGVWRADSHFVRTAATLDERAGRSFEVDRANVAGGEGGAWIELVDGRVELVGELPPRPARASLRGRFRDAHTLEVESFHVHAGGRRDLASYLGLAAALGIVALSWRAQRRRLDG